jgi:hypothetical protein
VAKQEFKAPVMNQEVMDAARAAGLSEAEIQQMFDAEYAERLQADVLSNEEFNEQFSEETESEWGHGGSSRHGHGQEYGTR